MNQVYGGSTPLGHLENVITGMRAYGKPPLRERRCRVRFPRFRLAGMPDRITSILVLKTYLVSY